MNIRVGHGYDVHRWGAENKPLMLGGVEVPHDDGLLAHSDGDVVLHAISDAVLGALGLGDIGRHFPDTDAQFAGADSAGLLSHIMQLASERTFSVGNIDVTIVAQQPKMAPHIEAMRQRIASLLSVANDAVNVKATTTEKLGFVGRNEGIACHAVVLMVASS
ncbi:2-C-methyl-D-erythritol 2,4-cyclodiphosphate synthase [Idiomarina fontislapidosi]|uniref:2-C-methyl-D-erythritol 2,4-cyclodiphosphate synthase n=1 Tax=Idiomarina fontislapidosi TaxID=263723 RepID=A0A432YCD3_9GAMM|nr:2-C-methyl-D-erythritol 2,4-cyclodiphosphate synthase [Idiomarina fontislapidosi]RUO58512.1 2-C-methyl-D-erythritol 2,4-cyclodiphosphate synthase [Idiomarina fontislapidosi]